ncbi:MAG: 30S ribosomal protein S10 [Planctomycetota bacterium]|nr:30S ribosomal protein S10 [Planctomycetota bacterium]MDI6788225.1 30S ribosomal protein S10 [Planctomycetota bacterium]
MKVRIKLLAYDHNVLDKAVAEICNTVKKSGIKISGPIPLPTKMERYTVLRSPHVDKKSREQFEIRTHKRLIELINPTVQTTEALKNLNVPSGVDIQIKVL